MLHSVGTAQNSRKETAKAEKQENVDFLFTFKSLKLCSRKESEERMYIFKGKDGCAVLF